MDAIFITSDPHRSGLNLSDKKIQKGVINMLPYSILVSTIHGKN